MSSVSGPDHNNKREQIRKNREQYQNKEAELIKKHRRELRQLNENHTRELDRMQETYQKAMDDLKGRSRTDLTDRDRTHQEEIDRVRDTYLSQIRKAAEDHDANRRIIREAAAADLANQKRISSAQQNHLRTSLEEQIHDKEQELQETLNRSRAQGQQSFQNVREKLSEKQEREMRVLREERQETLERAQRDYENLRKIKDSEIKDLRRNFGNEKGRLQEHLAETVQGERRAHSEGLKEQREGFNQSLEKLRSRFDEAAEEERAKTSGAQDAFKDSVNERAYARIRNLEKQIAHLKASHISDVDRMRKRFDAEKRNVVESFHRNSEGMADERQEMIQQSSNELRKSIDRVRKEKDQVFDANNRFQQDRIERMKMVNEEDSAQKETLHRTQQEHTKLQSDVRLKQIRNQTESEKQVMRDYMDEAIHQTREDRDRALREERVQSMRKKTQADLRLADELRKQEAAFTEKIQVVQDQYERQLAELKSQFRQEERRMKQQAEQRIAEQAKAADLALQTQELQHQRKIAQVNARHEQDKKDADRRHQAQLDHLVTHLKQN